MLLFPSSFMRASAHTPAETTGARVARFPVAASLPRYNGGSASAACFSRPARRLLAFSPAWSLNRLTRPFDARVLQSISLPPRTALAATNRSDSCCAGFAPARRKRLSTAHVVSNIIPLTNSQIIPAGERRMSHVDSLLQQGGSAWIESQALETTADSRASDAADPLDALSPVPDSSAFPPNP